MKKTVHYIYQHSNITTGEIFYVGLGTKDRSYNFNTGRSKEWKDYIKIHGKPKVTILYDNLTVEEADKIERELILRLGRKGIDIGGVLLNISSGGQKGALGVKQGPETLLKKSISMTGKKMHSGEQKQKWSLERTGKKTNWDPNHIKADKGRPKPPEFVGKGTSPVLQYDLNGKFIKEWSSQKEVFITLGIKSSAIWSNIKGITKQSGGFIWKYK
tara:strand:+ start:315 stop:959 length:645 start_codon:yes stop_codon:yes gene_type:complete